MIFSCFARQRERPAADRLPVSADHDISRQVDFEKGAEMCRNPHNRVLQQELTCQIGGSVGTVKKRRFALGDRPATVSIASKNNHRDKVVPSASDVQCTDVSYMWLLQNRYHRATLKPFLLWNRGQASQLDCSREEINKFCQGHRRDGVTFVGVVLLWGNPWSSNDQRLNEASIMCRQEHQVNKVLYTRFISILQEIAHSNASKPTTLVSSSQFVHLLQSPCSPEDHSYTNQAHVSRRGACTSKHLELSIALLLLALPNFHPWSEWKMTAVVFVRPSLSSPSSNLPTCIRVFHKVSSKLLGWL